MARTELVVVRHGEAECNVNGTVGGLLGCTGLTDRGRAQADRVAERLRAEHAVRPFDAVYVSPIRRARETAAPVVAALAVDAVVDAGLRPPDHGVADGQRWKAVRDAFGGPPQHNPDVAFAEGAESWNAYQGRMDTWWAAMLAGHQGDRIMVVAHSETVHAAHSYLLGLPDDACTRLGFVAGYASIARWQAHTDGDRVIWMLLAHNDSAHVTG